VAASREVAGARGFERGAGSPWLPAAGFLDEPYGSTEMGPAGGGETSAGRWRISFFEAVMLGVVGGAIGGGILGGLNASGAVDTVLTVEFGAVFGILVGVVIAVVLALASNLLAARRGH
jgi:hypothetical protein